MPSTDACSERPKKTSSRWKIGDEVPLGPCAPGTIGTANGATVLAQTTGSTANRLRGFGSIFGSERALMS